jgi:hypothetical protein
MISPLKDGNGGKLHIINLAWQGSEMCSTGNRAVMPRMLADAYEYGRPLSLDQVAAATKDSGARLHSSPGSALLPPLASRNATVFLADASGCAPLSSKTRTLADVLAAEGYEIVYRDRPDVDGLVWALYESAPAFEGKDVLFYLRAFRLDISGEPHLVTSDIWSLYKQGYDADYVKDNSYTVDFIVRALRKAHPRSVTIVVETDSG